MTTTSQVRLLTVASVMATALSIGAISVSGYRALIAEQQQRSIAELVHSDVRRLELSLAEAVNDTRMLAMLPSVAEAAGTSRGGASDPAGRVAEVMLEALRAKHYYAQVRLISADAPGEEIVRVERVGGVIRRTPDEQLQPKGDRYYVREAIALDRGEIYVSPIDLNREHGVIETPHRPMVRIASRVDSPDDGRPVGVVVINVAYQELVDRRLDSEGEAGDVFITNASGDYLTHPDVTKAFGFDLGKCHRLQEDYPDLGDFFSPSDLQEEGLATVRLSDAGILHVEKAHVFPDAPDRYLAYAILAPSEHLAAGARQISRRATLATVVLAAAAVFGAIAASRTQSRSIERLTSAVNHLAHGEPLPELPASQNDELGVLIRAFNDMAAEVRRKEAEVLNANERLCAVNQDLEHFVHIAAHDLREPLRKQRNLVDLLRCEGHEDELLDAVWKCSADMQSMIDDFRELTRLEGAQPKSFDLGRIIQACVDDHTPTLLRRGARIKITEPLPDTVTGHPGLVSRLYDNLVRNALQHARGDGFDLDFTCEKYDGQWVFGVRNTGSSIPPAILDDIFSMFRRTSTSAGSGVGLSICRKVVTSHNGNIWAESTDDSVHVRFTLGEGSHGDQSA